MSRRARFPILPCLLIGAAGCPAPEKLSPQAPERARLARVKDGSGAVRIEGLGPIRGFARSRDCTFMHCLELVLHGAGRTVDYDELMGLSGMAFRLQFRTDRWDVGNPDPLVGENCVDYLFSQIGVKHETRVVRRDEQRQAAALRQEIADSIDRGMPALAANIMPPEDWGIITGYQSEYQWLCRSYNGDARESDRPARGWPTAVVLLKSLGKRPPVDRAYADSLRRAVQLYERRKSGAHAVGAAAFDYWIQHLRGVQNRDYLHANAWTYVSLMDARAAAVRYLRKIARQAGAGERFVLQAADYYDQEVRLLQEGYRHVPAESMFPDTAPPYVYRDRQIQVLRQARTLEDKAIDALRRAT